MTAIAEISAGDLRDALDHHEPLTILDVRTAADRAEWSIPGSLHVDAYERLKAGDRSALDGFDVPTDRPVVTVCGAGVVSLVAADMLRERGIDAMSLRGGMKGWSLAWNTALVEMLDSPATVIQVRRTGKGCLSYIVGCDGDAVVVDPALDPDVYLHLAAERGWTITRVIDTHVHADHLSRSRALADRAGATYLLPRQERVRFDYEPLDDGDSFQIGRSTLRAIATPGHTNESMSYLLDERALITGDTLFLTSVGRPDLEATADESRARAAALYHSLRRIEQLRQNTIVLPGHVSEPIPFDGTPLSATLAEVRSRVELLREDEAGFVESFLGRIPPTPPNHHAIVQANEAGTLPAGDVTQLEAGANRCAVV
ncbi:MAG TPA: MBL fold metallo-hydrolase [Thermomicrobiales bacterium]|nr:MBL fold metallo-hydrolase [Thermomicrobiales bacterium]